MRWRYWIWIIAFSFSFGIHAETVHNPRASGRPKLQGDYLSMRRGNLFDRLWTKSTCPENPPQGKYSGYCLDSFENRWVTKPAVVTLDSPFKIDMNAEERDEDPVSDKKSLEFKLDREDKADFDAIIGLRENDQCWGRNKPDEFNPGRQAEQKLTVRFGKTKTGRVYMLVNNFYKNWNSVTRTGQAAIFHESCRLWKKNP
jgi:hypothetical protein